MFDAAGHLVGEILIERPAHREVHHLKPTTDAEDRLVLGLRPSDQQKLRPIARGVAVVTPRMTRLSVVRRIDIGAAGKKDPVQLVVDRTECLLVVTDERNHPRKCTNQRERADIPLAHHPGCRDVGRNPADALKSLSRNADNWTRRQGLRLEVKRFEV